MKDLEERRSRAELRSSRAALRCFEGPVQARVAKHASWSCCRMRRVRSRSERDAGVQPKGAARSKAVLAWQASWRQEQR